MPFRQLLKLDFDDFLEWNEDRSLTSATSPIMAGALFTLIEMD